jgi:hypothetical protein
VLCDDANLTGRFEAVAGGATVIRTPGGGGALSEEVLQRAVAKAVFIEGCSEVLLVCHTACTLAAWSANDILESLQERGVPRSAVPFDIREWVGAGRDPRESIRLSADLLRRCGYLPKGIRVDVAQFDDASGQLQLIEKGETAGQPAATNLGQMEGYSSGPVRFADGAAPPPAPAPAPAPAAAQSPPPVPAVVKSSGARSDLQVALGGIRDFVMSQMPAPDRAELRMALEKAATRGDSPRKMGDIIFRHILFVRGSRDAIGDELLAVREALTGMQPRQAVGLLNSLLAETARRSR